MKQWRQGVTICVFFIFIMGGAASLSMAGGVITYHVKIKNDTAHAICTFDVVTSSGKYKKVDKLHPTLHARVETHGMDCFVGFDRGTCYIPYKDSYVLEAKCLVGGREPSSSTGCASVACYSADWFIRKGSDGKYHFHRE